MSATRLVMPPMLVMLTMLGGACESAQEKCDRARDEAEKTWSAYTASLEAAMNDARDTEREGKERFAAIERRLSEPVKLDADARYERASGAWMRAFQGGLHKACMADDECAELKQKLARAADTLEDFSERLVIAQKALAATRLSVQEAKTSAKDVGIHADYPALKAAQHTTEALVEQCGELPPPKPPEE